MASSASSILLYYFVFRIAIVAFCISISASIFVEADKWDDLPKAFTFPIKKDGATRQYLTPVQVGVGSSPINLVIDVGGQVLWYNNDAGQYNRSSFQYVSCEDPNNNHMNMCPENDVTIHCNINSKECSIDDYNPILIGAGSYANQGSKIRSALAKDVLIANSTDVKQRGRRINIPVAIPDVQLSYVSSENVKALAPGACGVVGLGNSQTSLPAQIAMVYNLPVQFSMCLPSSSASTGILFIGLGNQTASRRGSLTSTRTAVKWSDDMPPFEYYLPATSISIDGETVPFDSSMLPINHYSGYGGVRLSTALPFTVMHSEIFKPFVSMFVEKATAMKMKQVGSVAPFGACFDSRSIKKAANGEYSVPSIDLVLEQGNKWTIHGHNSLVNNKKNVMCLAFVDGGIYDTNDKSGVGMKSAVILGGHQMQNIYMEFEADAARLRFSSSLVAEGLSCSHLRGYYL